MCSAFEPLADEAAAGDQAGAGHAGVHAERGPDDAGVLGHEVDRMPVHGHPHGPEEVVAGHREFPAHHDEFRIEQVDQTGRLLAQVQADLLHGLDAQDVLAPDGVHDLLQRQGLFRGKDARGEDRGFAGADAREEDALERLAGDLRFVASPFAASADDLVVEAIHMPEFPGKAGFPAIDERVDDNAHPEAPVDIDHQHAPAAGPGPQQEFPPGHRPGVVVQGQGDAGDLVQAVDQRLPRRMEPGVAVAGDAVDASGQGDADAFQEASGLGRFRNRFPQQVAHPVERPVRFHRELIIPESMEHAAPEIHESGPDVPVVQVQAQETAGIPAEPVQLRPAAAGGIRFPAVFQVPLLDQGCDVFDSGPNADVQGFSDLGNRATVVPGAQGQDLIVGGRHRHHLRGFRCENSHIQQIIKYITPKINYIPTK